MKALNQINLYKQLTKVMVGTGLSIMLLAAQPSYAATTQHVVSAGETLSGLATRYNVSQTQLIDANGLSATHIKVGQRLNIPNNKVQTVYRVKSGDSLYSLARRYNIGVNELARANNISKDSMLVIGETLVLPSNANVNRPKQPTPRTTIIKTIGTEKCVCTPIAKPPGKADVAGKHRVAYGETLSGVAKKYGTSIAALARANNLTTQSLLQYGQVLNIPSKYTSKPKRPAPVVNVPSTYRVKSGNGLIMIARKFNVSLSSLAQANGLQEYDQLMVGQVLKLPSNASVRRTGGGY